MQFANSKEITDSVDHCRSPHSRSAAGASGVPRRVFPVHLCDTAGRVLVLQPRTCPAVLHHLELHASGDIFSQVWATLKIGPPPFIHFKIASRNLTLLCFVGLIC